MSKSWWTRLRAWAAGLLGKSPSAVPEPSPRPDDSDAAGDLPEWAQALGSTERLRRFELAILADLRGRSLRAEYHDGTVTPVDAALEGHRWGLANLAQLCAGSPEDRWPALIAHHFDIMVRVGEQEAKLERELKVYTNARAQLVPRLWDEQVAGELRDHAVWRQDIPGILTVLSIDLPESIRTVSREMLDGWGIGEDQAFARAFDNLDTLTERKISPVELGDGQRLLAIEGPSYYTAALALKMDAIPELTGRHGAFVGMPTRHVLLSMPFDGAETMQKLHHLMLATRTAEQQGPGSLSHRVYWYRLGKWHEVPFEISPNSINVMTPRELAEYLQSLSDGGFDPGASGENGDRPPETA